MLAKKVPPAGAPAWTLTYGDMMSLLLCFFILLAAFADYDKGGSADMAKAIQSIQEALGIRAPRGNALDNKIEFSTLVDKLTEYIRMQNDRYRGDTSARGIQGENFRLRRIRDGLEITLGGPVLFQPFSDQLTPEGREALEGIAKSMKGHRNKLEIRGHAAEEPRPADWTDKDAWRLSYARAERVAQELVTRGVNERTLRLVAVGATEPVNPQALNAAQRGDNRRVEIFVRESLIDDFTGEQSQGSARDREPQAPSATEPGA